MPQCWHVAPGRSCKCPGQGMGPGTLRYPDTSMAQFPSLRARNGNKQYILAADETIPSFFTMKYIQTYIPGSHEKSNLCIDHMYLCAARFSRRLLNVFECCAILLNCRMWYIQRGSKFPLWVLSLWNCATASRAPREDRPWRMGRPYLWRTFSGQLCLRICRCQHPICFKYFYV